MVGSSRVSTTISTSRSPAKTRIMMALDRPAEPQLEPIDDVALRVAERLAAELGVSPASGRRDRLVERSSAVRAIIGHLREAGAVPGRDRGRARNRRSRNRARPVTRTPAARPGAARRERARRQSRWSPGQRDPRPARARARAQSSQDARRMRPPSRSSEPCVERADVAPRPVAHLTTSGMLAARASGGRAPRLRALRRPARAPTAWAQRACAVSAGCYG